jgi:hypothetical protein
VIFTIHNSFPLPARGGIHFLSMSHKAMSTDPASHPHARKTHLLPLGAAIALALGMVLSTFIAAGTWKEVRKRPDKNNMGIININAANSTGTSNEGNNDTSSCEKDIITIVHAEYEVK